MRLLCTGLFVFGLFAACSHDHGEAYATYQECYDDHVNVEALPFQEAVVVCCTDHEIGGKLEACGATAADCVTYLGTNLPSTATPAEVQAACDEYVVQKGM